MTNPFNPVLSELLIYIEDQQYKGWDPYDGLNSKIFQALPIVPKIKFCRLAWIQFFKRASINLRPILGISKDYNAKGLGLFLSGYCHLHQMNSESLAELSLSKQAIKEKINFLVKQILKIQSEGWSGSCWGYNFDWQARAFFQPKNTPTVVVTSFVGNALLDAYEIISDEKLLNTARSACNFILNDLNRNKDDKDSFAFSYSPLDSRIIFNASLLGSHLLSRVYNYTRENELLEAARKSVTFCCRYQKKDGSWTYGTLPYHQWIDNFHTGYNLVCIADFIKYSGDPSFKKHLNDGYDYYIQTFFTEEGIPKYFNNSIYPIDIHAPAQFIVTLEKLGKLQEQRLLLHKVLEWTISNMKAEKGYFYFQINKYGKSKIPYMRWAQAWMFYALSDYFLHAEDGNL